MVRPSPLLVVLQPPGQSGLRARLKTASPGSCSLQTASCRCQEVPTLHRRVHATVDEEEEAEEQARLHCDSLGAEGCRVGAIRAAALTILTMFQSAFLLLAQLTKEQATQQLSLSLHPPSRSPRGAFETQECLARSANSQPVAD